MTSALGLLSVFADVAILLALAAAVLSPRLSSLMRTLIATFAFACAWLMTAVSEAMRAPAWTVLLGATVIVVCIVLAITALHIWTQAGITDESASGDGGDNGGGGPERQRPDAPQRGGGGTDPVWWPEFEHQFALHVAEREEKRPPAPA